MTVEADGSFSHVFNVAEDGDYQLQATLLTNRTPGSSVVGNVVVAMEKCPVPAFADMTITTSAPTCPATTGSFAVEGRLDDAYPDTEIVVRLLDQEGEEVQSNQVKLGEDSSFEVIMSGAATGDYQVEYSQVGMEETVIGTEDVSMGDCTPRTSRRISQPTSRVTSPLPSRVTNCLTPVPPRSHCGLPGRLSSWEPVELWWRRVGASPCRLILHQMS